MKKMISMLLALAMVCCLLPATAFASDIASGDCGERVTWRIEYDGALFITGTGEMDDYEQGTAPWYEYRDSITCAYIEHTVTYVGDYAFADCPNMKEVTFLGDKPEIGSRIFQNNPVVYVYYPAYCDGWEYFDYLYGAEDANWISYGGCEHEFETYTEPPACEGRGFTDYTCSLCGEYYQTDYVDNLGHEFSGEYVLGWEASCEGDRCWFDYCIRNCGCVDMKFDEGTALGHNYVDGACTRCGVEEPQTGGTAYPITGTWGDNLTWTLDEDGLLIISGNGEMEEAECDNETGEWSFSWWDYRDDITAVVIGDGVTSVATGAFGNYTTITSVSLPDTMQALKNGAFHNTGITYIYVPDSVTTMEMSSINSCANLEYARIPGGLYLGELFYNCVSLKSVEFGGDCESGMCGFYNCDSLTDLGWYTQSTIGISDFRDCDGFTDLVIPDWITDLDMCAFAECDNLESVTIPASVTSIDAGAFDDCPALAEIWFEGDAPVLDGGIFGNVVATAYYPAGNTTWTEAVMAEFGGSITWVAYEQTANPTSGTCGENLTWALEDGVLTITGTGAMFDYAEWWEEDGELAPWPQDSISSVIIEEGVTSIGANAFYLSNLNSVSIADSVTSIGSNAFYYCASLTEVTLPRNLTEAGSNAFSWTGLYSVTIPGSLKTIGSGMFGFCQQLQSVVIEEGVEEIGSGAFSCCVSLTDITIPDTVTIIGSIAFSECHSLRNITIPASVISIGDMAFYTDTGDMILESVKFCGDAPVFGDDVFLFTTAFCYYPAGNDTWASVIENTYGGAVEWIPYEVVAEFLPGDLGGDGIVDDSDVALLLWHTLFPDSYPIVGNADFNGDSVIDDTDVAYLLWHTLFPEAYPIG